MKMCTLYTNSRTYTNALIQNKILVVTLIFFFFNYLSDKNTLDCNANMPIYTAFLTRCMPYALKDNAPTVPSNNLHTLSPLCRAKKI